jgi:hypothetical protein
MKKIIPIGLSEWLSVVRPGLIEHKCVHGNRVEILSERHYPELKTLRATLLEAQKWKDEITHWEKKS